MIKVVDAVREIYVSDTRFVFSLPDYPGDIGTLPVLSRSEIFSSVDNNIVAIFFSGIKFVQQIRNTWQVLKCGAGKGWRRAVGLIM